MRWLPSRDIRTELRGELAATLQQRPSWRESPKEAAVIFVVFGITGSTSVGVVRPALKNTIGLEGSMREGPWSYRIISLLAVSPIYASFLVSFGTIAGRHIFFANMARKIFGRFLPASLAAPNVTVTALSRQLAPQGVPQQVITPPGCGSLCGLGLGGAGGGRVLVADGEVRVVHEFELSLRTYGLAF